MKHLKYSCDNDNCTNETKDLEYDKWIEIGADKGKLFINNHAKDRLLISMSHYDDIHFCSSKCMINRFFKAQND